MIIVIIARRGQKNKNNLNEKYEIIEKFKICVIFNKKEENEKTRKCEICENYLHIKCVKNNICTCKKIFMIMI